MLLINLFIKIIMTMSTILAHIQCVMCLVSVCTAMYRIKLPRLISIGWSVMLYSAARLLFTITSGSAVYPARVEVLRHSILGQTA